MGTNYYLEFNVCEHCGKPEEVKHLGKSSMGWTFSFQGFRNEYEQPDIICEADWRKTIGEALTAGGRIVDEYGDIIKEEDFWKLVESKRKEERNHTTYCRAEPRHQDHGWNTCWLDELGNSFSEGEFS